MARNKNNGKNIRTIVIDVRKKEFWPGWKRFKAYRNRELRTKVRVRIRLTALYIGNQFGLNSFQITKLRRAVGVPPGIGQEMTTQQARQMIVLAFEYFSRQKRRHAWWEDFGLCQDPNGQIPSKPEGAQRQVPRKTVKKTRNPAPVGDLDGPVSVSLG